MTFPTSDVNTSNADAGTDSPATFRSDVLDLITKFNLLRNHFSTLGQSLISRATATLARQDLGATTVGDALFTAANAAAARTAIGAQASLGYTAANDSAVVKLTGAQTIAGVKTFSSQPVLPYDRVLGAAVSTTSGTAIDFTGIPSWATKVGLMFRNVSTSGSSEVVVRGITSGGVISAGYSGGAQIQAGGGSNFSASTTGFNIYSGGGGALIQGKMELAYFDGTQWICNGILYLGGTTGSYCSGGVTLGAALTGLRLTTLSGTENFDGGEVVLYWER